MDPAQINEAREEGANEAEDPFTRRRWVSPPPDVTIEISPPQARAAAAQAVARHVRDELARGRSLYCIVRDSTVRDLIGDFDGRALPAACVPGGIG